MTTGVLTSTEFRRSTRSRRSNPPSTRLGPTVAVASGGAAERQKSGTFPKCAAPVVYSPWCRRRSWRRRRCWHIKQELYNHRRRWRHHRSVFPRCGQGHGGADCNLPRELSHRLTMRTNYKGTSPSPWTIGNYPPDLRSFKATT